MAKSWKDVCLLALIVMQEQTDETVRPAPACAFFIGYSVLACRLDDLQHHLVMSGMPLEARTSLMSALAALPHQQEPGLPGSQAGLVPSAPHRSPLGALSSQGIRA